MGVHPRCPPHALQMQRYSSFLYIFASNSCLIKLGLTAQKSHKSPMCFVEPVSKPTQKTCFCHPSHRESREDVVGHILLGRGQVLCFVGLKGQHESGLVWALGPEKRPQVCGGQANFIDRVLANFEICLLQEQVKYSTFLLIFSELVGRLENGLP